MPRTLTERLRDLRYEFTDRGATREGVILDAVIELVNRIDVEEKKLGSLEEAIVQVLGKED